MPHCRPLVWCLLSQAMLHLCSYKPCSLSGHCPDLSPIALGPMKPDPQKKDGGSPQGSYSFCSIYFFLNSSHIHAHCTK